MANLAFARKANCHMTIDVIKLVMVSMATNVGRTKNEKSCKNYVFSIFFTTFNKEVVR
jgi:hypothetical protein